MFQVLVKPCWYCWFQFLLPHNQVGTPTWRHHLVLFLIIINLIIFHHTNSCCALFSRNTTLLFWIVVSLKVFQPVKACVAVKLLNLVVVIPYLRYFPKNVVYIYILEILSPKCEMLSPTWKTICCFWSQIVCNQQYDALKVCREFIANFSEAIKIRQDHLWWW